MPLPNNLYDLPLADMDVEEKTKQPKSLRLGGPRGVVTENNARLLAFIGMFPGADAEAISVLNSSQKSRISTGGDLMSVRGTKQYLRKLYNLGALEKLRDDRIGAIQYGLTDLGIAYASEFGYDMSHASKLVDSLLFHKRMIAHVAAQFASPVGFFKDSLGVGPVDFDQLITEPLMTTAYEPVKYGLQQLKKQGKSGDYGKWRRQLLLRAIQEVKDGRIEWPDLLEAHPALYTVGVSEPERKKANGAKQPDLVINLDRERTNAARNLLVEVEVSKKSWQRYEKILATLKTELDNPYVYKRAVYFTIGPEVENSLRKVDKRNDFGLFESGKLVVLPICDRDGEPLMKPVKKPTSVRES